MYEFKTNLEPFARAFLNCESESKRYRCAVGMLAASHTCELVIETDKGLCRVGKGKEGVPSTSFPANVWYRYDGIGMNPNGLDQLAQKYPEHAADFEYIKTNMSPWLNHVRMPSLCFTAEQNKHKAEHHLWAGEWIGHANPNHSDVCKYGTIGLKEKIEKCRSQNPGKDEFYDASAMTMETLEVLGKRFHDLAIDMLQTETDPAVRTRLEKIKSTFEHAPQHPCRDFAEAIIVYLMVFTLDGTDSPGHFDQFMYPFWKVTEPALRREYLEALWKFFYENHSWNLCIGGSDENWNDLSNSLSYAILDIAKTKKYRSPNLTMRCHRNTPPELLHAAYEAIATGCGLPALYNDEAVCPALESLGIPPHDAHLYAMNGCNQIEIQGKGHMGLDDGQLVIAKALELALHNGISGLTGAELGPRTGDAANFATYDELYAAFITQLDHLIDIATSMANAGQRFCRTEAPNPFRSVLIEGCLEKGKDYKDGGPLYGHGQLLAQAIADTADSLAAVKKYVFEEKRFTMAELVDALNKNFEGYDEMYYTLKNSELKFGNDIEYVDKIAGEVINYFNSKLRTIKTERGGYYTGGCSPFNSVAMCGKALAALPNGLKKEDALIADSIGATPGCDVNGPTALLNSCLAFDQTLPGSGFILNLKFDKELFSSQAGEEAFTALVKSYFDRKGQMLTFTVVSEEELRDAQIHPEAHRDLMVRVGGYCDYFVNIRKELQDNVIARTSLNLS